MKTSLRNLVLAALICFGLSLSGCMIMGNFIHAPSLFSVVEFAITLNDIQKDADDFTPENEYYIGRAVTATIFTKYRPYDNSRANNYLNLLGTSLAYSSRKPETYDGYHFQILDSNDINAFGAPGGFVVVTRGLLACASSEDELAAILAHEIGHVALGHGMQAIAQSRQSAATANFIGENMTSTQLRDLTGAFGLSIDDLLDKLMTSGYSQAQESEADHEAVVILKRAGYDPMALVRVLETMKTRLKPGGLDFAKTHPDPDERIADVKNFMGAVEAAPPPPPARAARFQAALGTR
jgi:predicted Zn-dependent protease